MEDSIISKPVACKSSSLNFAVAHQSDLKLKKSTRCSSFRLLGEKADNGTIELNLIITSFDSDDAQNVQFSFFLNGAIRHLEMVEQLGLGFEDANAVAELMQGMIEKIVPGWTSCLRDLEAGNLCSPGRWCQ